MPNTILTSDVITKEALAILHNKLVFTNKIDMTYDSSFAASGAKIGDTLRIKMPAQFGVRRGNTYAAQEFINQSKSITVNNTIGIDVDFTAADLALSLDDFSKQFLEPAMSRLAAQIESDCLSMILTSANSVYCAGGVTYKDTLLAAKQIKQSLAPEGGWKFIINDEATPNLINELKGLYNDSKAISEQYRTGLVTRTSGFDFYESSILPTVANPADIVGTMTVLEGASTVALAAMGVSVTIPKGFRFKVAGSYKVNPELKTPYPSLYEFVVLEDVVTSGTGTATVKVYPVFSAASGARQNISALPAAGSAIVVDGAASLVKRHSIAFQKSAFSLATADLEIPGGMDMASRMVFDGISMRFVRGFDITNNVTKSRFDILFGYTNLREGFACLVAEPNV